jgi:hypothetical protein
MARSWHATKATTKIVKNCLLVGGTPMVGSQHATMTIEDEKKEFLKLKIVNCINFYVKDLIYHHIVYLVNPCEMWETPRKLDETKTS